MRSAHKAAILDSKHVVTVVMIGFLSTTLLLHHLVWVMQGRDAFTHEVNKNTGLVNDRSEIDHKIRPTKEKLEKSAIVRRSTFTTLVLLQVVYIRSTDYDRTLMTAECVAAGLFTKRTILQGTYLDNGHPVPIHSVPLTTNKLLRPSYACQYIKDLRATGAATHASKQKIIFDKEYMSRLSKATGMDINVTSLHDLADVVFCEKQHALQRPEWLTTEMEDELITYSMEKGLVTHDVAKYLMGTLFDTLMTNMKNKITNPSDPVKLNLFSAHESTVRFLKALLGADDQKEVPYIGAIIIELYHLNNEHYIRFLYRNSSDQPQRLLVNNCNNLELCRFSDFQKAYKDLLFPDEDWNEVCEDDPSRKFNIKQNLVPILVAVLVLALVMFLGYRLYALVHQRRHKLTLDQYTLLETDGDAEGSDKEEFAMEDFIHLVNNHKTEEEPKESP